MGLLKGCSGKVAKGCFAGAGCLLLLAIAGFVVFHRGCGFRHHGPASAPAAEAPAPTR
jgi:hypothetical protein